MDFNSLSTYGHSASSWAWLTNPLRRLLWRLVSPYVRGAGVEISAAIEPRIAALEGRHTDVSPMVLEGLRMDMSAAASRLGGLEEEADGTEKKLANLSDRLDKLQTEIAGSPGSHSRLRGGDHIALGDSGLMIVEPPGGLRMLLRPQDHIGRRLADGQEWEPHVRKAIEETAQADGIAIDAGAYIGIHTLTMARRFTKVHAFEPQRGIYQMLCANLALNGCTNVISHNAALYDRSGVVRLAPQEGQETALPLESDGQPDYAHIDNAAALTFDFISEGSDDRNGAPAFALDDFKFENVRLIKIDTQGADLRVLQGALDTIRRCQPTVLFEWERDLGRRHGTTLEDFFAFFAGLNYDVTMTQETTPGTQADYIAKPRRSS
jgi:FkbM family methyltransferase